MRTASVFFQNRKIFRVTAKKPFLSGQRPCRILPAAGKKAVNNFF